MKVGELIGLTLLEPLVKEAPESDFAGNVIKQYLQKLSIEPYSFAEKMKMYKLAHDVLELIQRF